MKANAPKGYQFSITNGVVTKVFEVKNGYAKLEKMESNESWSVSGTSIIKTENEHGRTEITVYSDADGDEIFTKVSEKSSAGPLLHVVEGKEIRFSSGPEDVEFLRQYLETHHLENSNDQTAEMPESQSLEVELIGVSAAESGEFPM